MEEDQETVAVTKTKKTRKPQEKKVVDPIDWKSLIPPEYIDVSNDWYALNGINPNTLSLEEKIENKEKVPEGHLLIKLAGFKHVAHLRGIESVDYQVVSIDEGNVSVKCEIKFLSCEERGLTSQRFAALANASAKNTPYPFDKFLECMAENRAFIRAVRQGLNINVVGVEEMSERKADGFSQDLLLSDEDDACATPQDTLKIIMAQKAKTLDDLKLSVQKLGDIEGYERWEKFADIPTDITLKLIDKIVNRKKKEASEAE